MRIIDANKFLAYLIFSKHIDGLTCGEVKEAIEMCKVLEPCEDAISRQAVLSMQYRIDDSATLSTRDVVNVDDIEDLPSVTPQWRWIPASEKPNVRDWYLGIFKEPDTGWINPLPFICDYVGIETKATTTKGWILRGFTDCDDPKDYYLNLECVKWMPLPKTYEP